MNDPVTDTVETAAEPPPGLAWPEHVIRLTDDDDWTVDWHPAAQCGGPGCRLETVLVEDGGPEMSYREFPRARRGVILAARHPFDMRGGLRYRLLDPAPDLGPG